MLHNLNHFLQKLYWILNNLDSKKAWSKESVTFSVVITDKKVHNWSRDSRGKYIIITFKEFIKESTNCNWFG